MFDLVHIKKEGGKALAIDEQGKFWKETISFSGSKSKFYGSIIFKNSASNNM